MYDVILTDEYISRLHKIPKKFYPAIDKAIDRLAINPFLNNSKLKNSFLFKHEVSKYRILYHVNGSILEIWTVDIMHRKENYKNLKFKEKSFRKRNPKAFNRRKE